MKKSEKKQKSVAKNALFNVLYRVFNMIFPFVTAVYVSHILLASGVGMVSTAQNIVQYFVLLAPLGISIYGTREIAKIRTSQIETNKLFTELFSINFISTTCCVVAYYTLVFSFSRFSDELALYVVAGFPILLNYINVEWYYAGNEDYVYISIRSIIVKAISLLAIFLFVKTKSDYVMYALIYTLGVAGNNIFNVINILRRGVRLCFTEIKLTRHFKPIFILLCSNIAIELYTLLDTTMLGLFCSDEIVGYYTNSIKLVKIIVSLISAIGGVLLPRLSFYEKNGQLDKCSDLISKVAKIMIFFAIPCGLGVFLLAPEIVWVMFGESFMPAVGTVKVATMLIYVLGFSSLFGTQVLLTFNQEKKLLICTCAGAVSNITMNYFLIPMFQHNGAVIASVISETLVTVLTVYFSLSYIKIKIPVIYYLQVITAGAIMCIPVYFITKLFQNDMLCILLSVCVGTFTYLVVGICVQNKLVLDAKKEINKRLRGRINAL